LRVGDGQFMQEARGNEGYVRHWTPPHLPADSDSCTHTHSQTLRDRCQILKNPVDNQTRIFPELWAVAGPLWDA